MITLTVELVGAIWSVTSSEPGTKVRHFSSGGEAERAARKAVMAFAARGQDARLIVRLMSGKIAGTLLVSAGRPELLLAG